MALAWAARQPAGDVLAALDSPAGGLSSVTVAERLARNGANVLASRKVTALDVLWRQLRNPLLILLLAAAGISTATGDVTDGVIIAAIVVLSVGLGFVNEYRSEVAVAALHDNIHHDALVWRDGAEVRVDVRDLVPGDVIELHVGDIVPADVRLLASVQLECDEAVLTGESMPAAKIGSRRPPGDSDVDLPSRRLHGHRRPSGIGRAPWWWAPVGATAFGKIAVGLTERQSETAFQVGLRGFSHCWYGWRPCSPFRSS